MTAKAVIFLKTSCIYNHTSSKINLYLNERGILYGKSKI